MSQDKRITRMKTGKSSEDEPVRLADVTTIETGTSRVVRYSPNKSTEAKKTKAKGTTKSAKGLTWIPYFRSNLHSLSSMLSEVDLRETHLDRLKISPFFNLFNAINSNKDVNLRKMDSIIEELIRCYKSKEKKFLLGKVLVPFIKS